MDRAARKNQRFRQEIRRTQLERSFSLMRTELMHLEQVSVDFRWFKESQVMEVPISCVQGFQRLSKQELDDFLALLTSEGVSFKAGIDESISTRTLNCLAPNNLEFMANIAQMKDNRQYHEMLHHFFKETIKALKEHQDLASRFLISFHGDHCSIQSQSSTSQSDSASASQNVLKNQLKIDFLRQVLRFWTAAIQNLDSIELQLLQKIGVIYIFWSEASSIREYEEAWQLAQHLLQRQEEYATKVHEQGTRMRSEDIPFMQMRVNLRAKIKLDAIICMQEKDFPQFASIIVDNFLQSTSEDRSGESVIQLNQRMIKEYICRVLNSQSEKRHSGYQRTLALLWQLLKRKLFFKGEASGRDELADYIIYRLVQNCLFEKDLQAKTAQLVTYLLQQSEEVEVNMLTSLPYQRISRQVHPGNYSKVCILLLNCLFCSGHQPSIAHTLLKECQLWQKIVHCLQQENNPEPLIQWAVLLHSNLPFYVANYTKEVQLTLEVAQEQSEDECVRYFIREAHEQLEKTGRSRQYI